MAFVDKLPGEHCGWCRRALRVGPDQDSPKGAKLVLAALGVFLVPLLLALFGAVALAAWGKVGSVMGGVGGFALGLLTAIGIYRWAMRSADRHGVEGSRQYDHGSKVES